MSSNSVLLVNTNRMRPAIAPIALDYIGAAIDAVGHEVRMLDLCLADDPATEINQTLCESKFDLVAVTFRNTDDCYFASGKSFVNVLKSDIHRIRQAYDGPVLVGGCGFSTMPVQLLEAVGAEYGVRGDGEVATIDFLRALEGDVAFDDVPGLVFRRDGQWVLNDLAVTDLQQFDLSARNVVNNATYFRMGGQAGIETKRGCSQQCIYCVEPVVRGHRVRLRPPLQIVNEVQNLLARGVDCFHTCDSEFNLPISHAIDVCNALIEAGLGDQVKWYAYAMPSPFTPELGESMRRAGCVGIDFGADSGNANILRSLGRKYDASCLQETADICRANEIAFMYDLLLGAPGETRDTLAETIKLVQRVGPDCVGISLGVRIYGGTPLAMQLDSGDQEGIIGEPSGLDPYFYISPELGDDPVALVRDLIDGDSRFFLPGGHDEQDYNYNDNDLLEQAIANGERGAYWDILRRLAK